MKSITQLFAAMFILASIVSCEPSKKNEDSVEVAKETNDQAIDDRDGEKDADFVVNTIAASYGEIKLAELALSRSNDQSIKSTAEMVKNDHAKVVTDLKGLAATNGISIPLEESDEAKEDWKKLAEKNDMKDFNKAWCKQMVDKHQSSINNFEKRLDKTEDVELKNWIAQTLPTLKHHLEMLKSDEDKMSK